MITVSIFRSAVDDTRETQQFENPITIKELFPDVDFSSAIISVNGFLQDENYLLQDSDICSIRLFPEGNGADWLAGAGIGLMAALAVVNIWNPVGWGLTAAVLGIGVAAGALGFGIASAAGWSVTGWLATMGAGGADLKSPESLAGIPQLRGAKNQSNYGKPVPLVLGKHLFTPMYVGNPYSTIGGIDGEDQYFQALYMLGYGKLKVTDLKLGIIGDLASNVEGIEDGYLTIDGDPFLSAGNPTLELIQTGRESELYPQAVREEPLNIELSHVKFDSEHPVPLNQRRLDVVRFSAKNPMKIQVEITLPGGLIKYNDKGEKEDASVSIGVWWRVSRPNNEEDWKEFAQFGVGQENIEYANSITKITRTKTKVMRFVAEKTFSRYAEVSDAYDTRVIELLIYRINEQSDTHQIIDKVHLTAIRTWLFDNEKSKESPGGTLVSQAPVIDKLIKKTARLGFRIKATQNTQGILDALNCIVESKCRTWDKAAKKWNDPDWDIKTQQWVRNNETPSNNPAALALKLLQSPTLGRKAYIDDADDPNGNGMIDMESFGEFYEWCEEKKYTCNGVLTSEKRVDDVLALILSTGRATKILNGSRYGLLIDKKRDYPVMILNSQNVLEATNQKGFADLPDGFLVKFVNEGDGYQQTEEYVMADGQPPRPESVIESIDLPYITNREHAVKHAWYLLACRHLRPEIWNRKVSVEGYLIGMGDLVEVQDDTIVVGIGEGARVTGVLFSPIPSEIRQILEIQTDGQFDVSYVTNKQFGIKIMQFDGVHDGQIRTIQVPITVPGLYSNFVFNPPIELPFTPQPGDLVAFGEYSKITTKAICFGKKSNGDGTFDLTLIPYQEDMYTTDSGAIPPYQANITTPHRPVPPPVMPEYVEDLHDRISEVAKGTNEINNGLYQLILTIQSRILEVDKFGNVLAGFLPFNTQAILLHGVNAVPPTNGGIILYPGTDGVIFDPMLGDFFPIAKNIIFSLVDAPAGVYISEDGFVTVSKDAVLGRENYIIVQAEYRGQIYRTKLYISCGVYNPRYLGACYTPTGTQKVEVKIGDDYFSVVAYQGDWVAYLGETPPGSIWEKGAVMRFNGTQWEKVDPMSRTDSSLYMIAFDDIIEGAPGATFLYAIIGKIFTREIVIKENGYIESANYSEAKKTGYRVNASGIKIYNGIIEIGSTVNGTYQGIIIDGINKEIRSTNYNAANKTGWKLFPDGSVEFYNGFFRGALDAATGTFAGALSAATGTFAGTLIANSIQITGSHVAGTANIDPNDPNASNGVVAFDNRTIDQNNFVSIGQYGFYTKRIKIVGKGSVRFRVNYRGTCHLYKEMLTGNPGQAPRLQEEHFPNKSSQGYEWTDITELTEDVTFIQLYGVDWNIGGGTVFGFINTTFECRTASNPGIFKFVSSPF